MVEFLFGFFAEIFKFFLSFALVFAITFGVLSKTEAISDILNINAGIALAVSLVFAFSGAVQFILRIIPYFALLLILFAAIFLILFIFGYKIEELFDPKKPTSKFIFAVIAIVSMIFVGFTAWNMYSDDVKAQLEFYSLSNVTDDSALSANLTGNPFHDIPLRYEYQCTRQGRYLSPLLFFGQGGVLCLVMHPKVIGVFILIPVLALITFFIARYSGGKPKP